MMTPLGHIGKKEASKWELPVLSGLSHGHALMIGGGWTGWLAGW